MVHLPKTPLKERISHARESAKRWSADGYAAKISGDDFRANFCYLKSQHWLKIADRLSGGSRLDSQEPYCSIGVVIIGS